MNPSRLDTNKTDRVQHCDGLETGYEKVFSFALPDPKEKERLEMMDLIVHLSCDEEPKEKLRPEETGIRLSRKGTSDDTDHIALIAKIFDKIAQEIES